MSNQLKNLLIVVPVSFVSAGLTVLLYLLDPEFEANSYVISSMVIVTVWMFFIAPAMPFAIVWVKNYFDKLDFSQGYRIGYLLGCGWGVVAFIFFLIVSPVIGTIWYVHTINEWRFERKKKRDAANNADGDVFDM